MSRVGLDFRLYFDALADKYLNTQLMKKQAMWVSATSGGS
jgi:hypothetical protein